ERCRGCARAGDQDLVGATDPFDRRLQGARQGVGRQQPDVPASGGPGGDDCGPPGSEPIDRGEVTCLPCRLPRKPPWPFSWVRRSGLEYRPWLSSGSTWPEKI